jgi:hypothetical protein
MITRIAYLVGVVLVSTVLVWQVASSQSHADPATREQIDSGLQERSATMRRLKRVFPDAYDGYVEALSTSERLPTHDRHLEHAIDLVTQTRRQNAGYIRAASDGHLLSVVRADQAMYEAVLELFGPEKCRDFAMYGVSTLSFEQSARIDHILRLRGNLMLDAILSGRTSGDPADVPTDDDWQLLIDYWYSLDGSPEKLERMTLRPEPAPDLCELSITFFEAIHGLGGDAGHRIRADIVYEAAIN